MYVFYAFAVPIRRQRNRFYLVIPISKKDVIFTTLWGHKYAFVVLVRRVTIFPYMFAHTYNQEVVILNRRNKINTLPWVTGQACLLFKSAVARTASKVSIIAWTYAFRSSKRWYSGKVNTDLRLKYKSQILKTILMNLSLRSSKYTTTI